MATNQDVFTPLNRLTLNVAEIVRILVKVFITWAVTCFNNPKDVSCHEMILVDSEGHKIVASVMHHMYEDFKTQLAEGNFCIVEHFGVQPYKDKIKLVNNEHKVNFYRMTKVHLIEFPISSYGFRPVNYDDLIGMKYKIIEPIDVVGQVSSIQNLRVKSENGNETRSINFVLQDVSAQKIDCTVWGEHANQMAQYVSSKSLSDNHMVVLLHNTKLSKWRGTPQVSNHLFGCRIFTDSHMEPISTFLTVVQNNDDDNTIPLETPSINITTEVFTAVDDFKDNPIKKVDEIKYIMEARNKSVVSGGEPVYECDKCGRVKYVTKRSGTTSFVLFENNFAKILKRSCNWLHAKLDVKFVFRARVSVFNLEFDYSAYTVDQLTDDQATLDYVAEPLANRLGNAQNIVLDVENPVHEANEEPVNEVPLNEVIVNEVVVNDVPANEVPVTEVSISEVSMK
ncbi:uncharacterized protein [Rutidosis leptorrhynchoides]|uniref:uncharacterized protein n=1 Tax=Rutidosis leptorrhynchoides TaxID=125765 RepID=UPI003A98FACA